jgi:excisionase family DNA binding protein
MQIRGPSVTPADRDHPEEARDFVGVGMSNPGPDAEPLYVSTAQVAEALGVGITSVKRWVDQGILPAHKTPGGHRKILLSDVVRVVRDGDFPRLDLSRLGLPSSNRESTDLKSLSAAMLAVLKRGEADALKSLFQEAQRSGLTIETLADAVIAPAMRRLGHEWAEGQIDVWQEHRAPNFARPPFTRSEPRSRARPTAQNHWPSAAARRGTPICWRICWWKWP